MDPDVLGGRPCKVACLMCRVAEFQCLSLQLLDKGTSWNSLEPVVEVVVCSISEWGIDLPSELKPPMSMGFVAAPPAAPFSPRVERVR